jgi:hypothetical protein
MILAKIAVWGLGTVVVGGAVLCSEGLVTVRVRQREPDAHNIFVVAPAMLVPLGMKIVPRDSLRRDAAEIRPYLPMIRAAADELAKCPDVTLVDVSDHEDHVRVAKHWGAIVVDVDEPGHTVHVSVPIRAVQSTLRELADNFSSD